jgi:hypothetical protein
MAARCAPRRVARLIRYAAEAPCGNAPIVIEPARDRLMIVAKKAVEVRECDRCGKEPANTWLITGPGGTPREIDLCDQHGSPVANAYALARPVPKKAPRAVSVRARTRRLENAPAAAAEPEPIWR